MQVHIRARTRCTKTWLWCSRQNHCLFADKFSERQQSMVLAEHQSITRRPVSDCYALCTVNICSFLCMTCLWPAWPMRWLCQRQVNCLLSICACVFVCLCASVVAALTRCCSISNASQCCYSNQPCSDSLITTEHSIDFDIFRELTFISNSPLLV